MDAVASDQFGSNIPSILYYKEKDVIQLANNTGEGLGSSVRAKDVKRSYQIERKIDAGRNTY
ncbi:aldehyde dehydrogenase family protein [Oceanobacillus sp. CF4.6]|uniref:aldehyde dehydrogenase family protein n=1 Tax=Oceanobacillus sp. CF4.6 TaxID=3373080 RepID=UPI003EE72B12